VLARRPKKSPRSSLQFVRSLLQLRLLVDHHLSRPSLVHRLANNADLNIDDFLLLLPLEVQLLEVLLQLGLGLVVLIDRLLALCLLICLVILIVILSSARHS